MNYVEGVTVSIDLNDALDITNGDLIHVSIDAYFFIFISDAFKGNLRVTLIIIQNHFDKGIGMRKALDLNMIFIKFSILLLSC